MSREISKKRELSRISRPNMISRSKLLKLNETSSNKGLMTTCTSLIGRETIMKINKICSIISIGLKNRYNISRKRK